MVQAGSCRRWVSIILDCGLCSNHPHRVAADSRRTSLPFRLIAMVFVALCPTCARARSRIRPQKVEACFLAASTSYRTTWGMNEGAYLVELMSPKVTDFAVARLIDEYLNRAAIISTALQKSFACAVFQVVRDPVDPIATLPESFSYQPRLDRKPEPGAVLPCYRTARA